MKYEYDSIYEYDTLYMFDLCHMFYVCSEYDICYEYKIFIICMTYITYDNIMYIIYVCIQ